MHWRRLSHKLKGASAMFGQDLLEKQLAQLEVDARKDAIKDLTDRIRSLEGIAKQSEAIFQKLCVFDYKIDVVRMCGHFFKLLCFASWDSFRVFRLF